MKVFTKSDFYCILKSDFLDKNYNTFTALQSKANLKHNTTVTRATTAEIFNGFIIAIELQLWSTIYIALTVNFCFSKWIYWNERVLRFKIVLNCLKRKIVQRELITSPSEQKTYSIGAVFFHFFDKSDAIFRASTLLHAFEL